MPELADFDNSTLARLHRLGGDELVEQMIGLFLTHAAQRITTAINGEREGDWDAVKKSIHSLQSMAGNVGATTLQKLAENIEQNVSRHAHDSVSSWLRDLEAAFAAAKAHFEAHQQEVKRPGERRG